MESVPFVTDDAILAFALENAGVPRNRPPSNYFTVDSLDRLFRGTGKTLVASLREAWQQQKRGRVRYWFDKTPELEHFLAAYSDQEQVIANPATRDDGCEMVRQIIARAAGRDPLTDAAIPPMDEREALVRLTCVLLKGRVLFMDLWKQYPPRLLIPRPGAQATLGQTTNYPGFDDIPADASDDLLRKMELL